MGQVASPPGQREGEGEAGAQGRWAVSGLDLVAGAASQGAWGGGNAGAAGLGECRAAKEVEVRVLSRELSRVSVLWPCPVSMI